MIQVGESSRRALQRISAPVIGLSPLAAVLRTALLRSHGTILMLHRFHCPDRQVEGIDPSRIRLLLERLRKERRDLVSMREMFQRLEGHGPPLRGALTFTIDDGYADYSEVAAPIFTEYDCPVTVFVTTGFLDGSMWLWWDQIEYVIELSDQTDMTLDDPLPRISVSLSTKAGRAAAAEAVVSACESREPRIRDEMIRALADRLEVEVPNRPPPRYAPMSWDALRSAESGGARFGPHTVSHPILALCSREQSQREIRDSWMRLKAQASHPEPVFCYPRGGPGDFGEREYAAVRSEGLVGALTSLRGYASLEGFKRDASYRFRLPRLAYLESHDYQTHLLTGFERLWGRFRGES